MKRLARKSKRMSPNRTGVINHAKVLRTFAKNNLTSLGRPRHELAHKTPFKVSHVTTLHNSQFKPTRVGRRKIVKLFWPTFEVGEGKVFGIKTYIKEGFLLKAAKALKFSHSRHLTCQVMILHQLTLNDLNAF